MIDDEYTNDALNDSYFLKKTISMRDNIRYGCTCSTSRRTRRITIYDFENEMHKSKSSVQA